MCATDCGEKTFKKEDNYLNSENCSSQKVQKQLVLSLSWILSERNPHLLLVKLLSGSASMKISMKTSQKN